LASRWDKRVARQPIEYKEKFFNIKFKLKNMLTWVELEEEEDEELRGCDVIGGWRT
jgi:hypothetical protein